MNIYIYKRYFKINHFSEFKFFYICVLGIFLLQTVSILKIQAVFLTIINELKIYVIYQIQTTKIG